MNMNNDGTLPLILIPHTLTIAEDRKSSYYILIHYLVSSNAGLDSFIRTNPGVSFSYKGEGVTFLCFSYRSLFSLSIVDYDYVMTAWQNLHVVRLDNSEQE